MYEIILFITIAITGAFFVRLILKDLPILQNWAIGFLVGLGILTFLSFVTSWLGLKITYSSVMITNVVLLTIILITNLFVKRRLLDLFKIEKQKYNLSLVEKITFYSIVFFCFSSLFFAIYFPINVWDALALYDFRGKVIADTGFFVQISNNFVYFSHYPLFTSLTHTYVYLSGGNNPQFLYSLYLMIFAIIYYSFLRNSVSRTIALASTLLIVTIPEIYEHSTIAYTNFPYTVFYVCGILYLNYSIEKKKLDYLFISSVLIGLSTWVRSDLPFWLSAALLVVIYAIKSKRIWPIIVYFPVFFIIQQIWNLFASKMFGADYSTSGQILSASGSIFSQINLYRFYEVLGYLYTNVFESWGVVTILFIIAIGLNIWKRINIALPLLFVIFINILGLIVGTYVFSFKVQEWKEIADSATRMAMFFPPLMLYYVTLSFGQTFKK